MHSDGGGYAHAYNINEEKHLQKNGFSVVPEKDAW